MARTIYLDYAAATPMDKAVQKAMEPYFTENFYNPSALYLKSKQVNHKMKHARQSIAATLGAKPSEIIFTAGGTEANNLAIKGVMAAYPDGNCVVSAIEHESVLVPAEQFNHSVLPVLPDGRVDVGNIRKFINDTTVLISVMYANNEIGTIQPLKEISAVIEDIKRQRKKHGNTRPLYLHTDAAQAAAYLEIHVNTIGVDLMTINGGKIYGPKQTGVLYVKTSTKMSPMILGGGQERGMRSGTENVAGIVGMATALAIVHGRRKAEVVRLRALQSYFFDKLEKYLPHAIINGSQSNRLPNNIHITIPGYDNERLLMELDEKGVMCAVGSACSASNDEPSHVLRAIGLTDDDARSSLRFTMGIDTTQKDIDYTVTTLSNLIKSL